jgi:hypothetical protein
MPKTLHELRTTGFSKLRNGRIHIRCPKCGRKQSNAFRAEIDPPSAFLVETLCEKCSMGCKDPGLDYFDKDGNSVALCEMCLEKLALEDKYYCEDCIDPDEL